MRCTRACWAWSTPWVSPTGRQMEGPTMEGVWSWDVSSTGMGGGHHHTWGFSSVELRDKDRWSWLPQSRGTEAAEGRFEMNRSDSRV